MIKFREVVAVSPNLDTRTCELRSVANGVSWSVGAAPSLTCGGGCHPLAPLPAPLLGGDLWWLGKGVKVCPPTTGGITMTDSQANRPVMAEICESLLVLNYGIHDNYLCPGVDGVNDKCVEITNDLVVKAGWDLSEADSDWGTPKYEAACMAQTLIEYGYSMALRDQAAALLERLPDVVVRQMGREYGPILDRLDDPELTALLVEDEPNLGEEVLDVRADPGAGFTLDHEN